MNMNARRMPMSAWNCSCEKSQVPTPTVIVTAVKSEAVPRWRKASWKASGSVAARLFISWRITSKR
jgi:hypothetical protein